MPTRSTIALVEDDANYGRALARLLRASGFDVEEFGSAEAFLSLPANKCYDCLVLDVQLPGISGVKLFERLEATSSVKPTVFISAFDQEMIWEETSKNTECTFLRKPFGGDDFLLAVRQQLSRRGIEPAPSQAQPETA